MTSPELIRMLSVTRSRIYKFQYVITNTADLKIKQCFSNSLINRCCKTISENTLFSVKCTAYSEDITAHQLKIAIAPLKFHSQFIFKGTNY
ncbi:hypothetical protein VT06_07340 [Arsukibacterium sp. MJ3]|nr:hypothetical protein VT06_07340 [Arsukibacterium sp. MJ3]